MKTFNSVVYVLVHELLTPFWCILLAYFLCIVCLGIVIYELFFINLVPDVLKKSIPIVADICFFFNKYLYLCIFFFATFVDASTYYTWTKFFVNEVELQLSYVLLLLQVGSLGVWFFHRLFEKVYLVIKDYIFQPLIQVYIIELVLTIYLYIWLGIVANVLFVEYTFTTDFAIKIVKIGLKLYYEGVQGIYPEKGIDLQDVTSEGELVKSTNNQSIVPDVDMSPQELLNSGVHGEPRFINTKYLCKNCRGKVEVSIWEIFRIKDEPDSFVNELMFICLGISYGILLGVILVDFDDINIG